MNNRILIVGNSSFDSVITSDLMFYKRICGGNSIHAAMAAADICPGKVALFTNIPSNFPESFVSSIQQNGIDTSFVKRKNKAVDWEELFVYEENGDRFDGVFSFGFEELDRTRISEELKRKILLSAKTDVYSMQSFRKDFPLSFDILPEDFKPISVHLAPSTLEVHEAGLHLNCPIKTLDPGRYLIGMEFDKVVELISKTTVFAPSKKEMNYIFPNCNLVQATENLGKACGTNIVCKNGKEGCLVYLAEKSRCFRVGTFPSNVLDLTGAGDSFCGSLNASLTLGIGLLDAVRIATVTAAKAIETISAEKRNKVTLNYVLENYKKVSCEEV